MILEIGDMFSAQCLKSHADRNMLNIGITSGCYDLTHQYHVKYWKRCARHCDILVVGVDSDRLVRAVKGSARPIFNEDARLMMVEQSKYVAAAFIMDKVEDLENMCKALFPSVMFKNQDYTREESYGAKFCDNFMTIEDIGEITSTSAFIKKIKETC